MRNTVRTLSFAAIASLSFIACKKEAAPDQVVEVEVSAATKAQIRSLGFNTDGAIKTNGGYLVEGDILLTDADLTSTPNSPEIIYANEEHYRTNSLVNTSTYSVIDVRISSASSSHNAVFTAALDEAIRRYNALGLSLRFRRVSSGQDVTIDAYYQANNTLGSAGFPSSGAPYGTIRMNTYHYSTSTSTTNINYIGTIIAHEMGHCIGFRHTDYMNRAYSCGGSAYNEGAAGIGAVHIPGTPTGPSASSWMLACSNGGNRPFTSADQTALRYVY